MKVAEIASKLALGMGMALIATPALAGAPVPAPLLGAGAPALLALGGAYLLVRRFRNRR